MTILCNTFLHILQMLKAGGSLHQNVEVIWTFMLDYTKGWGVRRHSHDYLQMYFCLSGEGVFYLDGKDIPLKQDDCLIIHPNLEHELYPLRDGQFKVIDTKFYIHDQTLYQSIIDMPELLVLKDPAFRDLQESLRAEWSSNAPHSKDMSALLFHQALLLYLRQMTQTSVELPFYHELDQKSAQLTGIERRIADYLAAHYLEEVSLDQLADALCYSKNYLCKVFKAACGVTINEYGNFLRIRKSYDLVRNSNQKLSEIAISCGFSSIHYFSRVFRKYVGVPPSQVRDRDRDSLNTDIRLHGTFRYRYYVGDHLE